MSWPARLERNDHGIERISPEADLPTVEPETWERLFDLLFPPVIVELKVKPPQTGQEALTTESKRVQEPEAEDVTRETRRRPPVLGR